MTPVDPRWHALIDELSNALQAAILASHRLHRDLRTNADDATLLHQAVSRAVAALQTLRRGDGS